MTQPINVRWVIAHEPIGLFLKVAERFNEEINANPKTKGMFNFEVMGLTEYAAKYNNYQRVTKNDLLDLMNDGSIEMCHIYTTWLGDYNQDMQVLDLPFLFKDHAHVDRVVDGPLGKQILEGLAEKSKFTGLAFTYSGGYRIVPAKDAINSVDGFKGMKVRTSRSPVAIETFKALGAIPVSNVELEDMNSAADEGTIDAGESTYIRVFPLKQHKSFGKMIDTKHSVFMTSIVVGTDFFKGLDPEVQQILSTAAYNAAKIERVESVADVAVTREECAKRNIPIIEFSAEEQAKFEALTAPVYDTFKDAFTPGLIDAVRKA